MARLPQTDTDHLSRVARTRVRLLLGLLVPVLICAGPAGGQGRPTTPPRIALPVSSEAQGRLEAARRLGEKQQWEGAIPLLQGVIEDGDRLVSLDGPFVPARTAATRMIAAMPKDGRELYAILYGPEAERLYGRGVEKRSYAELKRVADLYVNTDSGVRACSAMAALLMDEGRYGAALHVLQRTDVLPLRGRQAESVLARKTICLARLADEQRGTELLEEAQGAGIETIDLNGRTWTVGRFMQETFERRAALRLEPGRELPQAQNFCCSLRLSLPAGGRSSARALCAPPARAVRGDGVLFVNRGGAVFAVDRSLPRILWVARGPGWLPRTVRALASPGSGAELRALHLPLEGVSDWRDGTNRGLATLSASGDRVYAVQADLSAVTMPERSWEARPSDLEFPNQLRCYDAATGRPVWSQGQAGSSLAGYWFFTAPALHGGRAYVLGARHGVLSAVCMDARTGEQVWKSQIGPLESRQEVRRLLMELYLSDANPPVVSRGVAVYPTGQGMLCGLNAHDGTLLWITRYQRAERRTSRLGQALTVPTGPWGARTPLTSGGLCILAPLDSRSVVAASIATGRLVWQRRFGGGRALLGETGGLVYVQNGGLTCLRADSGKAIWQVRTRESSPGVGAVTTDTVYLPTPDGVAAWNARTGESVGLLRCPLQTAIRGVLLPLDNGFLAAGRETLTYALLSADRSPFPPLPGEADPGERIARAIARACNAPPREGANCLRRALEATAGSQDPEAVASARSRIAPHLARIAVQLGDPEVLRGLGPAGELTPEARGALARARLQIALDSPAPRSAAEVYARTMREAGMLEDAGPFTERSLWTELARMVRTAAGPDAEANGELRAQFAGLVDRAARGRDERQIALLARHGPFPGTRAAALQALARLCRESDPSRARRALLASALGQNGQQEPGPLAGRLDAALSAPHLWSRRGCPVPPADPAAALPGDRLLIADDDCLHCVSARDGSELWTTELPSQPSAPGRTSGPRAPRHHVGPGYPVHQVSDGVLMVALPSAVVALDPADGTIIHRLPVGMPGARYGTSVPVPRGLWIRRAVCGLPVPPRDARPFRRLDDFLVSPVAACRVEAGVGISLFDPRTGEELFRRSVPAEQGLIGLQAAFAGNWLCALLPAPDRLLLIDPVDGQTVARWVLRESSGIHAMLSTGGQILYLADRDAIWRFDLRGPELAARWAMPEGIERLIYADAKVLLVESTAGDTQLLSAETGHELPASAVKGRATWARRRGEVLYLLHADDYRGAVPYGQQTHALGRGFALRVVRLEDGETLWEHAMPREELRVVGPPLPDGDAWLIPWSNSECAGVVALRASDGAELSRAELRVRGHPGPVSLLPAGQTVILGAKGTTSAFARREEEMR